MFVEERLTVICFRLLRRSGFEVVHMLGKRFICRQLRGLPARVTASALPLIQGGSGGNGNGARVHPMDPPVHAGGFFFFFCWTRQAVDAAFQGHAFGARPMQIWLPTAARTFFERRAGYGS
jgi:hypothetical protein